MDDKTNPADHVPMSPEAYALAVRAQVDQFLRDGERVVFMQDGSMLYAEGTHKYEYSSTRRRIEDSQLRNHTPAQGAIDLLASIRSWVSSIRQIEEDEDATEYKR